MSQLELSCSICDEQYSDEITHKTPRTLTACNHTICEECAMKWKDGSKIKCPFCRKETDLIDGDIKSLRKNFAVLEAVDELAWREKINNAQRFGFTNTNVESEEYENEKKLNIACDEDNRHIAVLYCGSCDNSYCLACSRYIHSHKSLKGHKTCKLSERPEPLVHCLVHPHNIAELVCEEESCTSLSKKMCHTCHQYGQHKGHKHELIANEVEKIKETFNNGIISAKSKEDTLKMYIHDIIQCLNTFNKNSEDYLEVKNKIMSNFKQIRNFINDCEKSLFEEINELEMSVKNKVDPIQMNLDKLTAQRMDLEQYLKLTSGAIIDMKKAGLEIINAINSEDTKEPDGLINCNSFKIEYPFFVSKSAIGKYYCMFVFHCFEEEAKMNHIIDHISWTGKLIWKREHDMCFLFEDMIVEFRMNYKPTNASDFCDAHVNILLIDTHEEPRIASMTEFLLSNNIPEHNRSVLAIHKHKNSAENMDFRGIVEKSLEGKSNWSFQYYDHDDGDITRSFLKDMIKIANDQNSK